MPSSRSDGRHRHRDQCRPRPGGQPAGTPVVTVVAEDEKEVQIAVPENDIADFNPGKSVKARFWSDDTLVLAGKVREVSGSADPQSRTFSVRVSLPNDPRVLIGMTATVEAKPPVGTDYDHGADQRPCRKGRRQDRLDRGPRGRDRPCPPGRGCRLHG